MNWGAATTLLLLPSTCPALSADLIGRASIIDGDTIEVHGTRIRLWGIDAPESAQLCRNDDCDLYRCGAKAANDLDAFIAERPVSCRPRPGSLRPHGRGPARSVMSIPANGWLVNGPALDWASILP